MHVRLLGQFNETGVGRHSENAYHSMMRNRALGMTLEYVNAGVEASVRRAVAQEQVQRDTTLFFNRCPADFLRHFRGRKIVWWFFESDCLAPLWIEQLRPFDQVWAPSAWAARVLAAHGLPEARLRVVESGFNQAVFHPAPQPGRVRQEYVFLQVGKYEKRKSIDETVSAFRAEFPAQRWPDVRLWLKADFPMFPERVQQLAQHVADDARIRVISGRFSDEDMADLYRSADAFVFPSKSEGFGLPCLEAIACGLPAIATAVSAQTAFLDPIEGLYHAVDYTVAPIDDEDYRRFYESDYAGSPLGNWALPSVDSLRAAMRALYERRAEWRERGRLAADRLRVDFSWDAIGCKAISALVMQARSVV